MLTVALVFFVASIALAACQGSLLGVYLRPFFRHADAPVSDEGLPKVAILLSLRGADPHLLECLKALMSQDYPDYDLRIVVDSERDPAMQVVRQAIEETGVGNVHVSPLRSKPETCSLQCASMAQMIRELDDSCEVAVHVDADMVVQRTFLRTVVQPLVKDFSVGAAHGNRWFMPAKSNWGSLVRHLWNGGGVVAAGLSRLPCGGTLAMRMSMLREADIARRWEKSLTSDVVVREALIEQKRRTRFLPSLMTANRESIPLAACLGFFSRQLLWSRLYHSRWAWGTAVLHAIVTAIAPLGSLILMVCGLVTLRTDVVLWAGAGFLAYEMALLAQAAMLEFGVRRAIRAGGGDPPRWLTLAVLLKLPLALPLTQCMHFLAVMRAVFLRSVTWRGITYEIRTRSDVRMVQYRPFVPIGGEGEPASIT